MTGRRFSVVCLAFALTACSERAPEKVTSTWGDGGTPKEVRTQLGNGLGEEVQQFHENGRLQTRGTLLNGVRHGVWNTYRKDGLPWSQVTYKEGVKEGLFRTWHVGGTPHIEGQHKEGVPSGEWHFYSTEGDLVETQDFGSPN